MAYLGINHPSTWSNSSAYLQGQYVIYTPTNGIPTVYKSLTNQPSTTSSNTPDVSGKWTTTGLDRNILPLVDDYNTSYSYALGDVVFDYSTATMWRSLVSSNTPSSSTSFSDTTKWSKYSGYALLYSAQGLNSGGANVIGAKAGTGQTAYYTRFIVSDNGTVPFLKSETHDTLAGSIFTDFNYNTANKITFQLQYSGDSFHWDATPAYSPSAASYNRPDGGYVSGYGNTFNNNILHPYFRSFCQITGVAGATATALAAPGNTESITPVTTPVATQQYFPSYLRIFVRTADASVKY